MWELLSEKLDWDEEKLIARMRDIDGQDDTVDGKISAAVTACPECGHNVNMRHPVCIYCGYRDFKGGPFAKV